MSKAVSYLWGPALVVAYTVAVVTGAVEFNGWAVLTGFLLGTWSLGALLRLHAWTMRQ